MSLDLHEVEGGSDFRKTAWKGRDVGQRAAERNDVRELCPYESDNSRDLI